MKKTVKRFLRGMIRLKGGFALIRIRVAGELLLAHARSFVRVHLAIILCILRVFKYFPPTSPCVSPPFRKGSCKQREDKVWPRKTDIDFVKKLEKKL